MEDNSTIIPVNIQNEMKDCFIDYAMSVIVSRALPDVRDGLKPVHRRILYAMHEQGFGASRPYRKSARIVGEVMGKYHPHGDQAIYQTMVRMVQPFSMRSPLIDGHGNFGSVDGDSPAASRYTEARMAKISETLLEDIDKETVDWQGNFDNSLKEPVVLPAKYPNLLVNGSSGIAVGMATNIAPHNLGEVIDGCLALLKDPEFPDIDLLKLVKGPDFPTGSLIMGKKGIQDAFLTGRGSIIQRAVVEIEEEKNNTRLIVTEIPFQVNKANLIIAIANLVRDKLIEGIRDLRDESDRSGMRLVVELKRDADPQVVLNTLYKKTQLQNNFGVINLVLVDQRPELLGTRALLIHYLNHRREIIRKRTLFDLRKAEERAHILEGLIIALGSIDEVIALIRASKDTGEAKEGLMTRFGLSDRQAKAILEMRLSTLTGLEREKISNELGEITLKIADFKDILEKPARVDEIISIELSEIKEKFSNPRRSKIEEFYDGEIDLIDLIPNDPCVITTSSRGYIKRSPLDEFRAMGRGRQGVTGANLKSDDFLTDCFVATNHSHILVFTTKGRVFLIRAFEIPETSRTTTGKFVTNLCSFQEGENYNTILCIQNFDHAQEQFLIFCTRKGVVKRTSLKEYESVQNNGKIAISIAEDDELIDARIVNKEDDAVILTTKGMCIRFPAEEVRGTGRDTMGVRGIRLRKGDFVVAMETFGPKEAEEGVGLLTVTRNGFGKKTLLSEYSPQHRGGLGLIDIITDERNGEVMAMRKVQKGDEMLLVSVNGRLIRTSTDELRHIGRRTKGVRIFTLKDEDKLSGMAILKTVLLEQENFESSSQPVSESEMTEGDENLDDPLEVEDPKIDPDKDDDF